MKPAVSLNQAVLAVGSSVRYVAILSRVTLSTACRPSLRDSSSAESDRYEELLVNPTILTIAGNRGAIDCGGLAYVLVRYGSFFQLVYPLDDGHVSVCIVPDADSPSVIRSIQRILRDAGPP